MKITYLLNFDNYGGKKRKLFCRYRYNCLGSLKMPKIVCYDNKGKSLEGKKNDRKTATI